METPTVTTPAFEVACFGELLWDLYEAESKDKEPIARTFKREIGGATANVAVTLARLGISVSVVGGLGDDKLGEALGEALADEGVNTKSAIKVKAPTGIAFIMNTATGEPSYIPYRNGSAELRVEASDIKPAMASASYVVVSSTSMMPTMRAATEAFLAAAKAANAVVIADLNVRAHLWSDVEEMQKGVKDLCAAAHLIKASERDLNQLAGKRGLSWLDENAKQARWILTRGENGAAAVDPKTNSQVNAPTKRVRSLDKSGAGDAFVGGVLAVLVKADARPGNEAWDDGKVWTRAMEIGHILGAKSVASVGATVGLVRLDDLKARLDAKAPPPESQPGPESKRRPPVSKRGG